MNPYLRIARVDHWIKNIFVIPGALVAVLLDFAPPGIVWSNVLFGALSICAIVSANYTINEFLDREFDRFHPEKRFRAAVSGQLQPAIVRFQYVVLALAGGWLAWQVNVQCVLVSVSLLLMGLVYNVNPVRTKDRVYLDVLSESINNPLRFLFGWYMVSAIIFPPSSILISYWMGGAFLMAVKRLAEYRMIADHAMAGAYRRSFKGYTEEKLLLSAIFYAMNSAFFLGIFLLKYRIEFVLSFPLFSALFVWYLRIGFKANSAAQAPERLYSERLFVTFAVMLAISLIGMLTVDIPALRVLQEPLR